MHMRIVKGETSVTAACDLWLSLQHDEDLSGAPRRCVNYGFSAQGLDEMHLGGNGAFIASR
jgi:hypothetical protein